MTYMRMDGSEVSTKIKEKIKTEVAELKKKSGKQPGLAVILVGADSASQIYVNKKAEACKLIGLYSETHKLPEETTEEELLSLIDSLNKSSKIHGILVQAPVPKQIDFDKVIEAIDPRKDVDGFHPLNVGKLLAGKATAHVSCTPKGIIEILDHYNIDLDGKDAVVVGRSNIVGKPIAALLLHRHCTVTICHSRTKNLKEKCKTADILIVAIGKANFVTEDMVKDGAVVIDVGMNRVDGKLYGDVDFGPVSQKASAITPVPRGVGPMTIAMLMQNTVNGFKEYFLDK